MLSLARAWLTAHSLALLLGAVLGCVWLGMARQWWGRRLPWVVWAAGVALGVGWALRWA